MIKVKIDDRGLQTLLKQLENKTNTKPLFRQLGGVMLDAVEENFASEGRPRWKRSKRAERENGQTLQDTGRLAKSITMKYDENKVIVGTNVKYGKYHQFGADIPSVIIKPRNSQALAIPLGKGVIFRKKATLPKRTLPARPFLTLTDEDIDKLKDKCREFLEVKSR